MTSLKALFGFRAARRPQRRRPAPQELRPEALEPRALLAVTVPPGIESTSVSIDDDVLVDTGAATIKATAGSVQIFGNSTGRIDAVTGTGVATLAIEATTAIGVTGAIGSVTPFDGLTLTSTSAQAVSLGQAVTLDDDLTITKAGSVTFGGAVVVGDAAGDDLTIDAATSVMFVGNVTVAGDLVITKATTVTFAGTLSVGGRLRIENASGAVRFLGEVKVGAAEVTSQDRVFIQGDFTSTGAVGSGDVTFTTEQVGFNSAVIKTAAATPTATLTVRPVTVDRAIAIASPPGVAAGLAITDTALAAIQSGWKRVVFGRELDGTGAVTVGSVGSQQGISQLLNTTTIVGGSVVVDDSVEIILPVDVTSQAAYLELVARGPQGITVNAPINQTADERNAWVRLTAAGPIALNAPIWATDTVSLTTTGGGTITQQLTAAAIAAPNLVVVADGAVALADSGNAFDTVAISTTNDDVVLREDSGYTIGPVTTTDAARGTPAVKVSGIAAGSGLVRLVTVSGATASTVSQTSPIVAAALGLEGTGTDWSLGTLATNDVDTLAAKTGGVAFRDADDLTIGTVAAVAPQVELAGIDVARTVAVTAGTTLTLLAAGDIVSAATSGTAVDLSSVSGILTAGDVTTKGGDAFFCSSATLTADVVIDVVDAPATGTVTFASMVNGSEAGAQSLSVTGNLDASGAIGVKNDLKSLTVTDGATSLRGGSVTTSGAAGQSYGGPLVLFADTTLTGSVATGGTVTGNGNALTIDGAATLGDAAEDTVTGISTLTVTGDAVVNASKVAATVIQTWQKQVTLGTDATFENAVIWFRGSLVGAGRDLTLAGTSVTLGDASADSLTGVDDLVVTGAVVLTGNTVGTTGTQTYNGGVTVTDATSVALTGKGFDFKGAIDRGDNGSAPPLAITANGAGVTFRGDVGTEGRRFGAVTVRSQGGVSLAGTLWSDAAVALASTKNAISGAAGNAIRTSGTIRLDAATGIGTRAAPIGIEAAGVSAATTAGGIFLAAVGPTGNLWIGAAGIVAPAGPIGLDARNLIGVAAGGRLRAGTAGVTTPIPVTWSIDRTADGGPGSLRQVILNLNEAGNANRTANANGLDAKVAFDIPRTQSLSPLVFMIATPLPELRASVEIVGWGVELQSTGPGAPNGLILGTAASGSTLQGLTLRNFREYGIQLRSAQGVTIDRVAIRSLNLLTSMGLYATGDLARTRITGSEFTGGLRGMLLDGARNLRVGSTGVGQGNLFADNRAVASQPTFAGTGIRAQGNCASTVVEGNTFRSNNYGFGFQAAQGLALRGNSFARSSIAAIFIDGNCTGSSQSGNTFGTGVNANKTNISRTRNARGV